VHVLELGLVLKLGQGEEQSWLVVGEVDVVAGVKVKVGVLSGVGAGGRALLLL
jgi:hypothetical protein